MRNLLGLMTLFAAGVALAQQQPQPKSGGARDLFYFGPAQKEVLPPIRKPAPPKATATATAPVVGRGRGTTMPDPAPVSTPDMGTPHLGIRYTLLLKKGDRDEAVDPDRNFGKGDCVAIEFESNRSGYLYVLAKETSGNWHPLFPSAELADEGNVIDPGQKVRTPRESCFEIQDPPGTETLFVALSRTPGDIYDLYASIMAPVSAPKGPAGPVQLASAGRVKSAVEHMNQQFGTRDLVIKKPAKAADGKASEQAVYVVNASSTPSSTVATKVEIRHR